MRVALLILLAAGTALADDPRPLVWPAGPMEVRITPAGALDASALGGFEGRMIPFGDKGDEPRPALRIAAARLADGGRTLVLLTDPHPRLATYSLEWRGLRADYDFSGVEASWDDGTEGARPEYVGWWPDLDIKHTRALTEQSPEHQRAFALLEKPGRLTLSTLLTAPKGKATIYLVSDGDILEATLSSVAGEAIKGKRGSAVSLDLDSTGEGVDLSVALRTGPKLSGLNARIVTKSDHSDRRITSRLLTVPWAPPNPPTAPAPPPLPFAPDGGDRAKGEAVFFSEEAKCSACHKVRGKGGDVGPDLSKLAGHDPATVYRDIADPSAVIRPEYVPYTVAMKDGRIVAGLVRAEGADAIRVLGADARAVDLPRADVDQLRLGSTSIMPVGLVGALGEARMRDLLTFLLAPEEGGEKP